MTVGEPLRLIVWLQPTKSGGQFVELIDITDGRDVDSVTFSVSLDDDTIQFSPRRQTLNARPAEVSAPLTFQCARLSQPGRYEAWIQISQQNRLILVLPIAVRVVSKSA